MEKFINPFTDFGFKKLFGEEANKRFLDAAEINQLNPTEQLALKYLRDLKNSMDTSYDDGKKDMVMELIEEGSLSLEKIASIAKIPLTQVQQIAQNL